MQIKAVLFDFMGTCLDWHSSIVAAYHHQKAWPDVIDALQRLKQHPGLEIYVHANGSTRLQLDLCRSAGLQFDMLFSSELLGVYKPKMENYRKVLKVLRLAPEECVTVAAHAYGTRGAKAVGMKTVAPMSRASDPEPSDMAVRFDWATCRILQSNHGGGHVVGTGEED